MKGEKKMFLYILFVLFCLSSAIFCLLSGPKFLKIQYILLIIAIIFLFIFIIFTI